MLGHLNESGNQTYNIQNKEDYMLLIWILTGILASLKVSSAVALWGWFGLHPFLTILMIIFLA
jgi:hypothetical protein